jgi:hypothetical protein
MTTYLVLSAFISKPISLLAISKASVFFPYSMYIPTQYTNITSVNYKLKCSVLISSPTGLPELS